jgi:EamA-like transporter family.
MLATVAFLWGASFLFIKVAVRELDPATLILGRAGLGALTLAAIVPFMVGGRRTVGEIRRNAGWLVVVALVNIAVPFWLSRGARRGSTPASRRSSRALCRSSTPSSRSASSGRCG